MEPNRSPLTLSPEDRALLDADLYLRGHPNGVPGLRERAPSNVSITKVRQTYQLPDAPKATWPRCCLCSTRQPHRHGYVCEFSDETPGLVGRECGALVGFDYGKMIKTFDAGAERAGTLRQVQYAFICRQRIQAIAADFRMSGSLGRVTEARRTLEVGFGSLHHWLRAATNGRIMGQQKKADTDAMARRDARLESALANLARRLGRDRDAPGVDKELLAQLRAEKDPVASNERLTKLVEVMIHQFKGSAFLAIDNFGVRLQRIEHALSQSLDPIRTGPASGILTVAALRAVVTAVDRQIGALIEVHNDIVAAHAFPAPANLNPILAAWNRQHRRSPEEQIALQDGALVRLHRPDRPGVAWQPVGSFEVSRATVEGVRRDLASAYSTWPS